MRMILTALVGTEILAQRLADPDWLVFDCRHDLTAAGALRLALEVNFASGASVAGRLTAANKKARRSFEAGLFRLKMAWR